MFTSYQQQQQNYDRRRRPQPRGKAMGKHYWITYGIVSHSDGHAGVPEDSIPLQTIPLVQSNFNAGMNAGSDKRRVILDPSVDQNNEYATFPLFYYLYCLQLFRSYGKRPQQRYNNNNNNPDTNSIVLHPNVNFNTNIPPHQLPSARHHQPHQHQHQPHQHQQHHHSNPQQQLNFKDNSTLLITNIPPDLNTIDQLNGHFKKFGNLVNIQV